MKDLLRVQRLFEIETAAEEFGRALSHYSGNTIRQGDRTIESSDVRHNLLVRARELLNLVRKSDLKDVEVDPRAKEFIIEGCSSMMSHASSIPLPSLDSKQQRRQLTACRLMAEGVRQARLGMPGGGNTAVPDDLITQAEAGEFADVDRSTINRLVKQRRLTGYGKRNGETSIASRRHLKAAVFIVTPCSIPDYGW